MKNLRDIISEKFFDNVGTTGAANTAILNQEACEQFLKSMYDLSKFVETRKCKFSKIEKALKNAPTDKYGLATGPAVKLYVDYMDFCRSVVSSSVPSATFHKDFSKVPAGTVFSIYGDGELDSQIRVLGSKAKVEIKETPNGQFESLSFKDAEAHILIHILAGYDIKYKLEN